MLLYSNATIEALSAHHIGNKTNGEEIIASREGIEVSEEDIQEKLITYFLQSFTSEEYYHLSSTDENFQTNPLYQWSQEIFKSPKKFHTKSVSIAKHLYEVSLHPQIKAGDLFVGLFSNIQIEGIETNVIAIIKSESKSAILKLNIQKNGTPQLHIENGLSLEKIDKGCLIYNLDEDKGFRLSIIDRSNKSAEAQYWKELFLRVAPVNNNFQSTKAILEIARHYVIDQISEEFELSKADQINYLNKSINYFKKHEEFNQREFEQEVFEDKSVIQSFRKFDTDFRDQFNLERVDSFEISTEVVKKQARVFKSVLKLDRNFHIYIHGDRELIERGVEKDGRKFYKIYYDKEI